MDKLPDPGFLYVMAMDDGHRKVGVSSDPAKRVGQVNTNSPRRVWLEGAWSHRNPFAVEKRVHRDLHLTRVGGEWFFAEQKDVFDAVLAALRAIPGGMLHYDDQPYFDGTERRSVGAPKKWTPEVDKAAREGWKNPDLTAPQVPDYVFEKTGVRISERLIWARLAPLTKSQAEGTL
jgi:hypothetical protein